MIRWLALLLLALNLVVAGWLLLQPDPAPPRPSPPTVPPLDAPRLALVQELGPAERQALERPRVMPSTDAAAIEPSAPAPGEVMSIPSTDVAVVPSVCVTLGPFNTRAGARRTQAKLAEAGVIAALREEAGQLGSGYWVYIPPLPTREAAENLLAELKRQGVGDLFVVNAADQRHAISLGLFSTPERADQRAAEIGKLGYRPRVAERFRDAAVFWLDFTEPPGQPIDPAQVLDPGLAPEPMRVEQPCGG